MTKLPVFASDQPRYDLVQIEDYTGIGQSRQEEYNVCREAETSGNVFPIIDEVNISKMQGLEYKIENEHIYIACNGQSSWHYIGSMKGVLHARIIENGGAVAVQPQMPGNCIILEINFPERGLNSFQIPYATTAEAAKALNKAEQLVKDLIDFCRKKETFKEASCQKIEKVIHEILDKQIQLYTLFEKQAIVAPKCASGNHN